MAKPGLKAFGKDGEAWTEGLRQGWRSLD